MNRFNGVIGRLLDIATIIPLDRDVFRSGLLARRTLGLSPQDAIVYASVHSRVAQQQTSPQCFINKNSRDFLVPEIIEDFEARNCKLIGKFSDGLTYVRSTLAPESNQAHKSRTDQSEFLFWSELLQKKRHPRVAFLFPNRVV